jgi:hypothetical protein
VFEFLTSQSVVDMTAKFTNILDAAKYIVAESYRLWLTYDERTDDITMIIIAIDDIRSNTSESVAVSESKRSEHSTARQVSRPVRTVMTKAKRKVISENWDAGDVDDYDFMAHTVVKTPQELSRLSSMVSANFMFQSLSPAQKEQIFQVMKRKAVVSGEYVIREGDIGNEMYIVDR